MSELAKTAVKEATVRAMETLQARIDEETNEVLGNGEQLVALIKKELDSKVDEVVDGSGATEDGNGDEIKTQNVSYEFGVGTDKKEAFTFSKVGETYTVKVLATYNGTREMDDDGQSREEEEEQDEQKDENDDEEEQDEQKDGTDDGPYKELKPVTIEVKATFDGSTWSVG